MERNEIVKQFNDSAYALTSNDIINVQANLLKAEAILKAISNGNPEEMDVVSLADAALDYIKPVNKLLAE